MSDENNDNWLEHAYDNFLEARDMKDWNLCKAIIEDTIEQGFDSAAKVMRFEMRKAQNGLEAAVKSL